MCCLLDLSNHNLRKRRNINTHIASSMKHIQIIHFCLRVFAVVWHTNFYDTVPVWNCSIQLVVRFLQQATCTTYNRRHTTRYVKCGTYTQTCTSCAVFVCNNPSLCYICMSIWDLIYGGMHLLGSRRNKINLRTNLLGFTAGWGTEIDKHVTPERVSAYSLNSQICTNRT